MPGICTLRCVVIGVTLFVYIVLQIMLLNVVNVRLLRVKRAEIAVAVVFNNLMPIEIKPQYNTAHLQVVAVVT